MLLLLGCAAPYVASHSADRSPSAPVDPPAIAGLAGCAPVPTHFVLHGGTVVGVGLADVEVDAGSIVAVGAVASGLPSVDVSGRWLVPAAIDSHVHLAYLPQGAQMAANGVGAVVDLAAPTSFLAEDHAPLRVLAAGPMITAVGGYPTRSWGRNGYGREVASASEAASAVDELVGLGAGVIKVPVGDEPALTTEMLEAVVARAHARGVRVATHALDDAAAAQAGAAGVDVLAHTPVETLSAETLAAWSGRAVVSTLGAFGGADATVANLAALHDAGATVLYGTDFGNTRTAGIDADELALLAAAGLTPAEILAAATSVPAAYWGFADLGAIAPGKAANILALSADPLQDPLALASPTAVWLDGVPTGEGS